MDSAELLDIIKCGESSKVQFKERLPHLDTLAHELIAFSNSKGGKIIFGVNDKTGDINGLSFTEMQQINQQIEIVSPGKLPNSLTVEEVKYGNPVVRNSQITKFATHTLPYSGLGSGIRRAFLEQPDMELENDIDGEQFIVRFPRKVE